MTHQLGKTLNGQPRPGRLPQARNGWAQDCDPLPRRDLHGHGFTADDRDRRGAAAMASHNSGCGAGGGRPESRCRIRGRRGAKAPASRRSAAKPRAPQQSPRSCRAAAAHSACRAAAAHSAPRPGRAKYWRPRKPHEDFAQPSGHRPDGYPAVWRLPRAEPLRGRADRPGRGEIWRPAIRPPGPDARWLAARRRFAPELPRVRCGHRAVRPVPVPKQVGVRPRPWRPVRGVPLPQPRQPSAISGVLRAAARAGGLYRRAAGG